MKIPSWLKEKEEEMHIPGVALVRLDDPRELHETIAEAVGEDYSIKAKGDALRSEEERKLKVIADAHNYVEQIKRERAADRETIIRLEAENAALKSDVKAEQRKSGLLELELTQALNNIQTREADFQEKERCLSLLQQVLDKFKTKAPPKKERKNGKKSTDPVSPSVDPGPGPGVPDKAEG